MSTQSNVVVGKEAVEGMMNGIKHATGPIRLTYGARGCNAVVEHDLYPFHQVANDAQTIVQAIHVEDPVEKRGLGFLKELMDKANKDSGDGRKTTAILAEEILEHGSKSEVSGVELKRELDKLIPVIEKSIDDQKKVITVDEVEAVATISSESPALGKTIGDIYKVIGKDGIIHVEGSGTFNTSYSLIEGVRFNDSGYLSPFMAHDEVAKKEGRTETRAVYENPTILVTKRKISHLNDINPLLATLEKQGKKDLVIFTDDMDSGVASVMVGAHKSGVVNILIIKAPVIWKNYVFEDFAKITGATIVEDASGINFKNLELKHLGTCEKIITDRDETVVMGIKDISEHIADLRSRGDNDSLLRLQWLQTKTAILKLGANSESELSYLRLKAEDAINASRLALQDGVVAGGGVALINASTVLPDTVAGNILKEALKAPLIQIKENAGNHERFQGEGENRGYDVRLGGVVDMFEVGIIDAAKVTKNAVRNAISLASTILTSQIVVYIPEEIKNARAIESSLGKRMPF